MADAYLEAYDSKTPPSSAVRDSYYIKSPPKGIYPILLLPTYK